MRKQHFLSIVLMLFCLFASYGQKATVERHCITDQLMEAVFRANPEVKARIDQMNEQIRDKSSRANRIGSHPATITIPVVVYVVYASGASNISDFQVQTQITALNNYFGAYNVHFCLATQSNGAPLTGPNMVVPGIFHLNNSTLSNHDVATEQQALVNISNLPRERYLRIYVVNSISGLGSGVAGYSMFPNSSAVFDGIVMKYDVFGDVNSGCTTCNLLPNYDQGKTLVHEIGHYLGLYHTFEGECTGSDPGTCDSEGDRVCDTPQVHDPNFDCTPTIDTCPLDGPDDINNYMDYGGDSCINGFSLGQQERMYDMLTMFRSQLFTTDNLNYTGACGAAHVLSATFTATNYSPCTTTSVVFNPVNTIADFYSWDFGDGSPISTAISPSHTFSSTANSPYTVTLNITDAGETVSFSVQVFVSGCTPISSTEGRWYFSLRNGLNFGTGVPVPDNTMPITSSISESCAIQNSTTGSVLFYTNGASLWNSAHTLVNAVTPLMGHQSSKGGVVIVPNPTNTNQYYLFTKSTETTAAKGFRYSIINVSGSTVTIPDINHPITFPAGYLTGDDSAILCGEGVAAVQRCNNESWILATLRKNTGYFIAVYSLTSATGLTFVNEIAVPQLVHYLNSIEISPNGNKVVMASNNGVFMFDFNKYTGAITNNITIKTGSSYGAAFSPDSNLLYLTRGSYVDQYNVMSTNIAGSVQQVGLFGNEVGDLQKGPDNKIYACLVGVSTMGVIHSPNNINTIDNANACQYTTNGPILGTGMNRGLPNMVDAKPVSAFPTTASISAYPVGCGTYQFYPNACGTAFKWIFTNPDGSLTAITGINPLHTFIGTGNFSVTLKNSSNVVIATMNGTVGIPAPVILGSEYACASGNNVTNNSVVLQPGQTAVWSVTGGGFSGPNNQSSATVHWTSLPGTITLTVTNAQGCSTTVTKVIQTSCSDGADGYVRKTRLQSDGKVVIAGEFTSYHSFAINRVARLNSDLSRDTSFNIGTGADNAIFASVVQPDGKVIVGGAFTTFNGFARDGIARLNANGSVDTGFTVGTGTALSVLALEQQSDGKILMGGSFTTYNGASALGIARLNTNGILDATFVSGLAGGDVYCIAIQSDGKIILGGNFTTYGGFSRQNIVRVNTNGTIDATFNPGTGYNGQVHCLKIQSDGKILVGGSFTTFNGAAVQYLNRLNSNGTSDVTFTPPTITLGSVGVMSIDLQADSKIFIGGGFTVVASQSRKCIARLNANGTFDNTFSPGTGFISTSAKAARVFDCIVQPNGKILTGGYFMGYNDIEANYITRIDPNSPNIIGRYSVNKAIVVHPNPTADYFTITSENETVDFVEIYNALGQIITSQKPDSEGRIDAGNLVSGIYYLRIYGQGKFLMSDRVVKQ